MASVDPTKSKRVATITDGTDVNALQDNLIKIGSNMRECQEFAISVLSDKKYTDAAKLSLARFIDLFEKDCKVPMTPENIAFHAEMRGRMSERLRLTLELDAVKKPAKILEGRYETLKNRLAQLIKRRGDETNDK